MLEKIAQIEAIAIEKNDKELYNLAQDLRKEAGLFDMARKGVQGLGQIATSVMPKGLAQTMNQEVGNVAHQIAEKAVKPTASLASTIVKPKLPPLGQRAIAINGKPIK